jgi:formyl-CoA transferase
VQIAVGSESIWRRFAPTAGLSADDQRFAANRDRVAHRDELVAAIEAEFTRRDRADILAELDAAGVPAGAIRTIDEVYEWEQTRSQGLLIDVEHAAVGRVQLPGPSLRFESADGRSQLRHHHDAPPTLGQHTDTILGWLDQTAAAYGEDRLAAPSVAAAN